MITVICVVLSLVFPLLFAFQLLLPKLRARYLGRSWLVELWVGLGILLATSWFLSERIFKPQGPPELHLILGCFPFFPLLSLSVGGIVVAAMSKKGPNR